MRDYSSVDGDEPQEPTLKTVDRFNTEENSRCNNSNLFENHERRMAVYGARVFWNLPLFEPLSETLDA